MSWAAEVKALGVAEVAAALGLTVRPKGRGFGPCPVCKREHRGSDTARGPLGMTPDGLGWICHPCQAKGDAVTLAALVHLGEKPVKGDKAAWRAVAAFCEENGLYTPETPTHPAPRRVLANTTTVVIPEHGSDNSPRRPPEAEVLDVWTRCQFASEDTEVRAWLLDGTKRRIDPASVVDRDLARALPVAGPLPTWCRYNGRSWAETGHRVIVALYNSNGRLESLHARAVAPATPKDKAASPRGAEVRGLVMADALGRRLLAGEFLIQDETETQSAPGRVIVTEGPADFMTWGTHYGDAAEDAPAVLGVIAGSWTVDIANTIPNGWTVIIRTDDDKAGDKYAETIRASVAGRCVCKRPGRRVST